MVLRESFSAILGLVLLSAVTFGQSRNAPFAESLLPNPAVTILVYNYAKGPPAWITAGERQAGRLLGEAGVEVGWLDCRVTPTTLPDDCQSLTPGNSLRVRILSPPRNPAIPCLV